MDTGGGPERCRKTGMEHNPTGGTLRISGKENPLYTEIKIEDEGPGIDPEDLPHLFERFYRGKQAAEGSFGIGLALARAILIRENRTIPASRQEKRKLLQSGSTREPCESDGAVTEKS